MLNLHSGGELITLDALSHVPVPEATPTHCPLPHIELVNMVKYALGYYGHEVVDEQHAIDKDGLRYFGLLSLRSDYGDYTDTVGLRNSADKKFPIGISIGAKVFVCSNLSFCGDYVIRRKHTPGAKKDLPGLVAGVIEPLRESRIEQAQTFQMYRSTALRPRHVDHAIMQLFREGVIGVQRIAEVLAAYEQPPHDWGAETAFRLFNAVTFTMNGRVMESPGTTAKLHTLMDAVCEEAFWDKAQVPHQEQQLLPYYG